MAKYTFKKRYKLEDCPFNECSPINNIGLCMHPKLDKKQKIFSCTGRKPYPIFCPIHKADKKDPRKKLVRLIQ